MSDLYTGMEQWLVAERQNLVRPGAPTAFLGDKAAMLNATQYDPSGPQSSLNTGATKSRSHVDQFGRLLGQLYSYRGIDFSDLDRFKLQGYLASKALKVATGFSMRAGYFHPEKPDGLYEDRMVKLVDDNGNRLPVLGVDLREIEDAALRATNQNPPRSPEEMINLYHEGVAASEDTDLRLNILLLEERAKDSGFSGSEEAQIMADEHTLITKGLFVALAVGAFNHQGDGPDDLGPIILEPKSDTEAEMYLRIERLIPMTLDDRTQAISYHPIKRN